MSETAEDAFHRGAESGRVNARLDNHDDEITALKAGQAQISTDLVDLKLSTQQLAAAAIAASKTVEQTAKAATEAREATAAALKEAKDRDAETLRKSAQSKATWSPFQGALLVITAATGVAIALIAWFHG
jgi:predicted  nucleic acid-binding Zn-ribbon protein